MFGLRLLRRALALTHHRNFARAAEALHLTQPPISRSIAVLESDLGVPGPDRGEGGKYLIVPPDYTGTLTDGGFFIARARTNTIL